MARPGARMVLFHPRGRVQLAARHGRTVHPGDPLNDINLKPLLEEAGWSLIRYDDPDDHFLAVAVRHPSLTR